MDNIKVDRVSFVIFNSLCEGGLLLLATLWCFNTGVNLKDALKPDVIPVGIGVVAGIFTACSGFISLFLTSKSDPKSKLYELRSLVYDHVAPLCVELSVLDILLVAASTGFCEEIFFRGVLQSELGIIFTAVLFGMIHCATAIMLPYAIWTFVAGIFLGYLYVWTDSLWTPIFAHGINNLIVILYFKLRKP